MEGHIFQKLQQGLPFKKSSKIRVYNEQENIINKKFNH